MSIRPTCQTDRPGCLPHQSCLPTFPANLPFLHPIQSDLQPSLHILACLSLSILSFLFLLSLAYPYLFLCYPILFLFLSYPILIHPTLRSNPFLSFPLHLSPFLSIPINCKKKKPSPFHSIPLPSYPIVKKKRPLHSSPFLSIPFHSFTLKSLSFPFPL